MTDILSPDFFRKSLTRRTTRPIEQSAGPVPDMPRTTPGSQARVHHLIAYWRTVRNGQVPHRSDMDPRRIQALLPYTFILERIAPGLARFRVAGADLADLMGMDIRGMPLSAFFVPGSRSDLSHHLETVFDAPGILHATLRGPGQLRRPEMHADLVLLPLRGEDNDISRAIGCLIARGHAGLPPRRFEVKDMRVEQLTDRPSPPPKPERSEASSHLRLVVSN